ncbi:MAG: 2-C-methyl-D-erythritol 4-phosphate cytidylyltransferase, partial [Rhodobacteraceae bacterium]|nr:2-C-methyl-D-erythritol 4-phosphate cytidylyltransferase [Paracoccaceae bacterium]
MSTAAIIVAAGRGQRVGGDIPKQWRDLGGIPVAERTLAQFRAAKGIDHIVLVLSPEDTQKWSRYSDSDLILALGAADRAGSVRAGLAALSDCDATKVLIHDVARPCIQVDLIHAIIDALDDAAAAAPALPVTDALWIGHNNQVTGSQDRSGLYAAQTPQGFHYDAIVAAHTAHGKDAADDV